MFPYTQLGVYRALYVDSDHRLWVSQGDAVFVSDDLGQTFALRATFRPSFPHGRLERCRLVARLLRAGILGLLPLPDGSLLAVAYGQLLRCDAGSDQFVPVLRRPRRTMKMGQTPDGLVCAGEYFDNAQREPVHIYASRDEGRTWNIAHTFPARAIRHVHAIIYDPIRQGLLVLTGDLDHESSVLFTPDGFRTLHVLTKGSQRSRAVGIIPAPDGFYLPTDTPLAQNYVQFLHNDGHLQYRCPIAGSCLATCQANNWAFFGTAAEPGPVNRDPCATLYGTQNGIEWQVIGRWPVDHWSSPTRLQSALFQMGRVILPGGENHTGFLFATTIAVRGADGTLHRWKVS